MIALDGDARSFGGSSEWTGFEEIKNARTRIHIFGHDFSVRFSCLGLSKIIIMAKFRGSTTIDNAYEGRRTARVHFPGVKAREEIKKYCTAQSERKN